MYIYIRTETLWDILKFNHPIPLFDLNVNKTCRFSLPLSYSGVESLPVTVLNCVVVVEVLLLVLLHCGGGCRLFGGENICCHLLLFLAPKCDYLITDWGQLGAATRIPFLGAFT